MKRFFNITNGQIVPLKDGDETGLYNIECADNQAFLNSGNPSQLIFENAIIRWKTDTEKLQERLDAVMAVKKLDVVRALDAMGQLDVLLKFLNDPNNAKFSLLWSVAIEIELNDADTQAALQSLNIDISEVKKQILGL